MADLFVDCPYCLSSNSSTLISTEARSGTLFSVHCEKCLAYGPACDDENLAVRKYKDIHNYESNHGCMFCGNFQVRAIANNTHLICFVCYAIGPYCKSRKFERIENWKWI